jgi:hypothetical protein
MVSTEPTKANTAVALNPAKESVGIRKIPIAPPRGAQHKRIGQGVPKQALKQNASRRQGRSHQGRRQHPGKTQGKNDLARFTRLGRVQKSVQHFVDRQADSSQAGRENNGE